jgi:hypothetical protein
MMESTAAMAETRASLARRWGGEFVVIVFGILAALAVEERSQQAEERRLEAHYVERLASDLEDDLSSMRTAIEVSMTQGRAATTILIAWEDPLATAYPSFWAEIPDAEIGPLDWPFGDVVWLTARYRTFSQNRSTFEEILATGRLAVIQNDSARAQLVAYQTRAPRIEALTNQMIAEATASFDRIVMEAGYTPFDFPDLDDPRSAADGFRDSPHVLREVRRLTVRTAYALSSLEEQAIALAGVLQSYSDH